MIVTNVSNVMAAIIDQWITKTPAKTRVYDGSLSYETAITGLRTLKSKLQVKDKISTPLFAYSRSALKRHDGNRRTFSGMVKEMRTASGTSFKAFPGTFNFKFMFICTDVRDLESFETNYVASMYPRRVSVDLEGYGPFMYDIRTSNDLNDPEWGTQSGDYQAIGGDFDVDGFFILINDDGLGSTHPLIKVIDGAFDTIYTQNIQIVTSLSGLEDKFTINGTRLGVGFDGILST
jgi:hypothetical protein